MLKLPRAIAIGRAEFARRSRRFADRREIDPGMDCAPPFFMATAWRLEDLIVWQLAVQLRDEILRMTDSGRILADRAFRDQIRDAASSVPRNVAEGFGLFQPRQFAKHLRLARGSLFETKNHLEDGRTRQYFSDDDAARLLKLTARVSIAATRLIKYLDSCRGEAPTGWGKEVQRVQAVQGGSGGKGSGGSEDS